MSESYHKTYWALFWVFFLLLTPFTGTFSPRSQELFWLFIAQPVAALLIAWICVRALIMLSEIAKRGREAEKERRRRPQARVQAEADRIKTAADRVHEHRAAQQRLASQIESLITQSVASAGQLPNLIAEADMILDDAEYQFGRRAFVRFWDTIEAAAKKLATAEMTVQRLIENAQSYQRDASKLETPAPPFRIGLNALPDASHTANRLRELFGRTETDFEFSTIFQQRTTNKLLIAGFSTITQAIEELPDRLQSSFGQLASSIHVGLSDWASRMASSQERMTLELGKDIRRSGNQPVGDAAAEKENWKKLNQAVDNIQRRKMPRPHRLGDGEY